MDSRMADEKDRRKGCDGKIELFFAVFGLCYTLVSDKGLPFNLVEFSNFLSKNNNISVFILHLSIHSVMG